MSIFGILRRWWKKLFKGDDVVYVYKPGFKLWHIARINTVKASDRNLRLFSRYIR